MDFDFQILLLLGFVGLVAGFIDAIAGGGGLLTIPTMLLVGMDPVAALATNKLQSTFGSATAAFSFFQKGYLNLKKCWSMVASTFLGAVLGAKAISIISSTFLQVIIPILLLLICLYFIFKPDLSDEDVHARFGLLTFNFTAAFGIGFYDGIFGPGTGSFFMIAFVSMLGFGLRKATAHTKLLNFTSNAAALLVFSFGGHIVLLAGLVMGLGQMVGARFGALYAIKHGAKLIKPLLILMCLAMCTKLLLQKNHPLVDYIWSVF